MTVGGCTWILFTVYGFPKNFRSKVSRVKAAYDRYRGNELEIYFSRTPVALIVILRDSRESIRQEK